VVSPRDGDATDGVPVTPKGSEGVAGGGGGGVSGGPQEAVDLGPLVLRQVSREEDAEGDEEVALRQGTNERMDAPRQGGERRLSIHV